MLSTRCIWGYRRRECRCDGTVLCTCTASNLFKLVFSARLRAVTASYEQIEISGAATLADFSEPSILRFPKEPETIRTPTLLELVAYVRYHFKCTGGRA
jgi:hypothetical protein